MKRKLDSLVKIERIVCSGGGAKCPVYPGACRALDDANILKGIDKVAGASVGSITVAFLAAGMTPQTLHQVILSNDLKKLLGDNSGSVFGNNPQGISFITKNGKPLEAFIRAQIIESIRCAISKLQVTFHPEVNPILQKLKEERPRITFRDLGILHQAFPEIFKDLIVPAVKFPTGEIQIFNKEHTPDVEVALACRASSAIPAILEPVEIEINGDLQKFVDGGVYDNLPTDYFDIDDEGKFVKNKKVKQTLLFTFGEGEDDQQNCIFQALYGQRWDEVVTEALLVKIIDTAIRISEHDPDKKDSNAVIQAIKVILEQRVSNKEMTTEESKVILNAMKKNVALDIRAVLDAHDVGKKYLLEHNEAEREVYLAQLIHENLKPILYNPSLFERLKINLVVNTLGQLKLRYQLQERYEEELQRIRRDYPLRTVELHVGSISTIDFDQATQHARIMDAMGYLDTIDYLTNHDLHDPNKFSPDEFYMNIANSFMWIYYAILEGAFKDPIKDAMIREIFSLRRELELLGKNTAVIARQVYQHIKSKAVTHENSLEAFVLARSVEFHNKMLLADDLFKEVYEEAFKRSSFLSYSNIMGKYFFRAGALHEALKNKNMYKLYLEQETHEEKTREDKIYDALQNIKMFREAYDALIEEREKTML